MNAEKLEINVTRDLCFTNPGVMPPEYRRTWESCFKYGMITAGQNEQSNHQVRQFVKNDIVAAYLSKEALQNFPKINGYVAIGIIEKEAVPINGFKINGQDLTARMGYIKPKLFENAENEKREWVVGVKWIKKAPNDIDFPLKREFIAQQIYPKWRTQRPALFANPLIRASILNQPATIDFLEKEFEVKFLFANS